MTCSEVAFTPLMFMWDKLNPTLTVWRAILLCRLLGFFFLSLFVCLFLVTSAHQLCGIQQLQKEKKIEIFFMEMLNFTSPVSLQIDFASCGMCVGLHSCTHLCQTTSRSWISFFLLQYYWPSCFHWLCKLMALFLFLISPIKPFLHTPFLFSYYELFMLQGLLLPWRVFRECWRKKAVNQHENMERDRGTRTKQRFYAQGVHFPFTRSLQHLCCFNQLYTLKIKQRKRMRSWKFPAMHNRKLTFGT